MSDWYHTIVLLIIIVFAAALTTSKRKRKQDKKSSSISDSNLELSEDSSDISASVTKIPYHTLHKHKKHRSYFDLKGELRKRYALTAASADSRLSLVCSPLSALLPLGQLALGAEGNTAKELWKGIGVKTHKTYKNKTSRPKTEKKWIRHHFKKLLSDMKILIKEAALSIASRIYLSNEKTLSSSFKSDVESVFKSSIELVNMKDPVNVAAAVNYWVKHETRGYIKDLIKPSDLSRGTSLLLVNAIYFKGTWKFPFKFTKHETFYGASGEKSVPLMHVNGHYKYVQSDTLGAQIVEIPYSAKDSSTPGAAMLVILPNDKKGLPLLLNQLRLAPGLLNGIKLNTQEVKLSIPKFKIESELDMGKIYEAIGLREMLKEKSGLTSIVKGEALYVSKAIQKAVIEVTENGTTAAAASVIHGVGSSMHGPPEFKADHPFLFYIIFRRQQLFSGIFN